MGEPQSEQAPQTRSSEQRPAGYRGRRRRAEDHEGTDVVDEHLVAVDTTPTGRHSRIELEEMLAAADARDAAAAAAAGEATGAAAAGEATAAEAAGEATAAEAAEAGPPARSAGSAQPAPPAKASRAGRNLPAAIGIGVGLAAVVVASLAFRREAFVGLVALAVLYGIWELSQAMSHGGIRLPRVPLFVGGAAMVVAAWARGPGGLLVGLLLTAIAVALWRTGDGDDPPGSYARDTGAGVLVALYLPFLAGFAVLLAHPDDGAGRVIAFILTVVCSDVGGYAVGVLAGRHPMAPLVSPKKSWEGFAGSTIACAAAGSLLFAYLFHEQWWKGALFGLAIVVTATLGDLGESMLKRDLGIKDMGRLLPGHGGLMDRLDSLLPSAAVAYLILSAVLG